MLDAYLLVRVEDEAGKRIPYRGKCGAGACPSYQQAGGDWFKVRGTGYKGLTELTAVPVFRTPPGHTSTSTPYGRKLMDCVESFWSHFL